jgi:hypothetical protein
MAINTILQKIQKNPPLDFGTIFSNSIDLFKKTWLQGFLFFVLTAVVLAPLLLIIYIPLIRIIIYRDSGPYNFERFFDLPFPTILSFSGLFLLIILLVNVVAFVMIAGFYKIIKDIDEGKEARIGDIFSFFKGPQLVKAFLVTLMTFGITLLAFILCYLPIFYVMVPLSFTSIMFAYNPELSATEIIKASFSLGTKKWLIGFGLLFVSGLLAELTGLLLCFVGIFFTMSFIYLPFYFMYKQVVGFDEPGVVETEASATS